MSAKKMSNIVLLPGVEPGQVFREEKPAALDVLADAYGSELKEVVIIGVDHKGQLYLDSTHNDAPNTLYLMKIAENFMLTPQGEG